jgi:hypothetical protein
MSFSYKTSKSIIVDKNSFFIGTTGFNTTTTPSNEILIFSSDGSLGDDFGSSVDVGSSKIIVGAYGDDSDRGSAYIYDLDGSNEIKITASDGSSGDRFGVSVAVGYGRIIVGADQVGYGGTINVGKVYLYNLKGNETGILTASNYGGNNYFGKSTAIGNSKIVVGAYGNSSSKGSAYIFDLDGRQIGIITASDGASNDLFGESVAIGSGRIVVGACGDDSDRGSAYIYNSIGNNEIKITASDGSSGDGFGKSVAVGDGRIIVGAYKDQIGANSQQGSAYLFDLNGTQLSKITASDGAAGAWFGFSVDISNGRIIIGAWRTNNAFSSGTLYVFDLDGNEIDKIESSIGNIDENRRGWSVSIGDGKIIAGAPGNLGNISSIPGSGGAFVYDTVDQIHYLDQLDRR